MTAMSQSVDLERRGSVAVITVNNPPVNALSQHVRKLPAHLRKSLTWDRGKEMAAQPEKDVVSAAEGLGAEPPRPTGTIDQARLTREIDTYLTSLDDCRINVARIKQVLPSGVVASSLMLRWTILPNGRTSMTEVVATSPNDSALMNCVKAAMAQWTFTAPHGGPVPVERPFAFRVLPQR